MLKTINVLISATIEAEPPLKRCLLSTVVMIEKISNTPRINKLRVINIYEADYNFLLKLFWPKTSTRLAEATNTLGENL